MVRTIFDGSFCQALGENLERRKIVVTFNHWQMNKTGFGDYQPLQSALAHDYGHLSVQTSRNDWYLNQDLPKLMKRLHGFAERRQIIAIGFSMGGYATLRLSGALNIERALLVSPQVAVTPAKVPFDRMKRDLSLCDLDMDDLSDRNRSMRGFILQDPCLQPVDRKHALAICDLFPALEIAAIPFGGHPATKIFRESNTYGSLISAFLDDRLSRSLLKKLHRNARSGSSLYQGKLAERLGLRKQETIS